jgi:hypothetical protein
MQSHLANGPLAYAILATCLAFTGCASIEPVKGAPEVHTKDPDKFANVTVMPDGSRYVVISDGVEVRTTIILPPVKVEK